jgi:hypothetical protein
MSTPASVRGRLILVRRWKGSASRTNGIETIAEFTSKAKH